jgi:hypothetical protein
MVGSCGLCAPLVSSSVNQGCNPRARGVCLLCLVTALCGRRVSSLV